MVYVFQAYHLRQVLSEVDLFLISALCLQQRHHFVPEKVRVQSVEGAQLVSAFSVFSVS